MHIDLIRVVVNVCRTKTMMRCALLSQYIALFLLIYFFFSVKDGYNNLFAGNCTRHDRNYNTYRDGGWVSSLNNTLKLHSAIFLFFVFLNKYILLIFFGCLSFQEEFRTLLLCITDRICQHVVIAANRSLT